MLTAPLALFGDLGFQELLLVAVAAVMIFGKRLPEVAGQAYGQFQKLRRSLTHMWRETGIDEELRRIQRDVDRQLPRERRLPPAPRAKPPSTVARASTPTPARDAPLPPPPLAPIDVPEEEAEATRSDARREP